MAKAVDRRREIGWRGYACAAAGYLAESVLTDGGMVKADHKQGVLGDRGDTQVEGDIPLCSDAHVAAAHGKRQESRRCDDGRLQGCSTCLN